MEQGRATRRSPARPGFPTLARSNGPGRHGRGLRLGLSSFTRGPDRRLRPAPRRRVDGGGVGPGALGLLPAPRRRGSPPSYAALKESFRPGVFFTTRFQLSFPPSPRRYGRSTPAHPQRPCGPSLRAARGVFPSSCQSFCRSVCSLAGRRASLRRFGGAPPIEPHISRKIARIGTRSRRKA